jgi:hypothetical protein|uniref:Hedgehog/Intein (Hint) domain-containing protein n=1 Tax=viral metagenome TaxID=1070528 RepID=A0A6C0IME8_9ZZZZ
MATIHIEDIINPNSTGTLTITFNEAVLEVSLNAYVSLNPAYIGTIGDITSADGGITYTGTMTLNEGINRINNKVNLNYNGLTGEATYDVVESNGVTISNYLLQKQFDDDMSQRTPTQYVTKISPDGSHIGLINLSGLYYKFSTIIYEYDINVNDYVQKGSMLKTGTMIEFSNNGNYVLIRQYNTDWYRYDTYHYKYNANTLDWDLVNEISESRVTDTSMDGSGKKIVSTKQYNVSIYDYDETNNTLTETILGFPENKFAKISNDGNVIYISNDYLSIQRYNYDGTNWTKMFQISVEGHNGIVIGLTEPDLNGTHNPKFNISNDGKIIAVTSSENTVLGATDINGTVTNTGNRTLIMEYDEVNNQLSVKGNIIIHPTVGPWVEKSIDITGDGNRIVVGDTGMQHGNNRGSELEGKVEIYDYNSVTNNWDLYSSILGGGGETDDFGSQVSITSDGTKITGTSIKNYTRIYNLVRGIERTIISMSMSDSTIKFPEVGSEFEVKFTTNEKTIEEMQGNITLEPITAGTLTNVTLGNNGFSLVGTYNAATQTETTGNKLKYNEGALSDEVEFVLSTLEKAISNICFYGDAQVLTNEGYKEIREVKKGMKVQGEEIEEVTRTISKESDIVLIKKGSIMKNMPLEDTRITKEHKVLYKGKMLEAKELVNGKNIVFEKYKGETLYNILLSGEGKMVVNGMIVETLSPFNNISKLYQILKGHKEEEKREIIKIYNEERVSKKKMCNGLRKK